MTRGERARELALSLGAASAQGATDRPPVALDAAILFAPVGDLALPALEALDRGGTLAIAGIYLSDIPALNYERHLFQERQVRSVTSNTRNDAREFLAFAGQHHIEVTSSAVSARSRRCRAVGSERGPHRRGGGVVGLELRECSAEPAAEVTPTVLVHAVRSRRTARRAAAPFRARSPAAVSAAAA